MSIPPSRRGSHKGSLHTSFVTPKKQRKPLIIACGSFMPGHIGPVIAMTKGLIQRGYEVTVVTAAEYKSKVDAMGASFEPLRGMANNSVPNVLATAPFPTDGPPDMAAIIFHVFSCFFMYPIFEQYSAVQRVVEAHAEEQAAGRPIIVVAEFLFMGLFPFYCGAPSEYKPTGIIALGVSPQMYAPGLSPGSKPTPGWPPLTDGLDLSKVPMGEPGSEAAALFRLAPATKGVLDLGPGTALILKSLGATRAPRIGFDDCYFGPDRFLQLCTPSVEPPKASFPLKYAGVAPMTLADASTMLLPDWWTELRDKKVVFVTQGTVACDYRQLIIPTIKALENKTELLVVVVLGVRGASLPPDVEVPANARVVDYFPYDLILGYASIFVTNAGYGGVQQSLAFGVPMIMAGESEDKPLVSFRMAEAGVGIDLATGNPTEEQIAKAVDTILTTDTYTKRAREIEKEIREYDSVKILDETIRELVIQKEEEEEN